ncbi:MAG TPA: DUF6528 family protein [Kofleriaceae bacterium]|nr:DUF6528 family protein [Kofleriaceae bacterium]
MFATHSKFWTTPLLVFAVLSITSQPAADADTGAILAAAPAPRAAAASGPVAIVDQRHGVMIFNLASQNWNRDKPSWSWSPRGDSWRNLSDVKFRSYGGRNTLLVTASSGRAATVDYATRRVTWTATPGGNPHSIELLPSGAVVVASSATGRLTVYGKGHETSDSHVELPDAHAVLWDAKLNQLWALGGNQLCRYSVEGPEARPKLRRAGCVSTPPGGHDLSPVHGNPAEMWLST